MSRRQQNPLRKLDLEKSQIRSILNDFRKAKHKAIALSEELQTQFERKNEFQAIEKQIMVKFQLLDVTGLVQLKNKLVKSLSDLFDIQSELNTQKQRLAARKQFHKLTHNGHTKANKQKQTKNLTMKQIRPKTQVQTHQSSKQIIKQQTGNSKSGFVNIPVYKQYQDSSQNKVQRITKFVASLKSNSQQTVGNMKQQCQQIPIDKIRQILHQDPEYIKMKDELERVKKQKQVLQNKVRQMQHKSIQQYMKNVQIMEEHQDYKIVKIYTRNRELTKMLKQLSPQRQKFKRQASDPAKPQPLQPVSPNLQTNITINSTETPSHVEHRKMLQNLHFQLQQLKEKRKDTQIKQIQKQLQHQQYNVQAVVQRISSTLQNNQVKLKKLRQQRKLLFEKEQNVWAELQQI